MNVLFAYLVPPRDLQILRYQQGLGSISAVLKEAGHQTALMYVSDLDRKAIDRKVEEFKPDLVGISVTSCHFPLAKEVSAYFASKHNLPVVLGGIHPTLQQEESIACEGVFAICVGEGEYPMRELCEALETKADPTKILNLWVKHNGEIKKNPIRSLITELDKLPFPDREIFNFDGLLHDYPEAEFMGSRGCPFRCTYCANHALVQLYRGKGPYVRYRPIDNLLDEIGEVTGTYKNIAWIGFHDDTFTLRINWLREFAEKYPKRFSVPFWCNATAKSITEEVAALLKKAGCYEVRIGVESGNDHIRMDVLEKNVTREEIIRAFRLLKEKEIDTYAFNMIGLPYETPETLQDTIRLNQEVQPNEIFCSVYFPYPGTKSYDVCEENGWLTGKIVKSYFEADYTLDQPTITSEEILFYRDIFADLVHTPQLTPLIKILHRIPVTPNKSLWNAIRRIRTKLREFRKRREKERAAACNPEG